MLNANRFGVNRSSDRGQTNATRRGVSQVNGRGKSATGDVNSRNRRQAVAFARRLGVIR
jgi:hypothetical protein